MPDGPRRREHCPLWITDEMLKAAWDKSEDIMNRVQQFEEDLIDNAEAELARRFNLTDAQASELYDEGV